ncbi:MAG: hypothetical protein WC617_12695 [Rhodanobacter sp.]|jgi:hypothetical protein
MADLVKAVQLTTQLYHMRDTMRSLWGEQYPERIAPWQSAITKVADSRHLPTLQAAIQLAKAIDSDGFGVVAVMAAYVEMVEPNRGMEPKGATA